MYLDTIYYMPYITLYINPLHESTLNVEDYIIGQSFTHEACAIKDCQQTWYCPRLSRYPMSTED